MLRLVTTAAVLAPYGSAALTNREAWELLNKLMNDQRIGWIDEPHSLTTLWKRFAARDTASPKLWMDGYLAAFAIAGGHQLVTTDHAFKQFTGLDLLVLAKV